MKRYYLILMAGLAALACQSVTDEPVAQVPAEKDYVVFEACASPRTRSNFNPSDEGTENEGKLYWDASDKVGILSLFWYDIESYDSIIWEEGATTKFDGYMQQIAEEYPAGSFIGKPMVKYVTSDLCSVVIDPEDKNMAKIRSNKTMPEWLMNVDEVVHIGIYDFIMMYPMSQAPNPLVLYKTTGGLPIIGIPVRVEPEQYVSEGFGRYQICVDSGFDFNQVNNLYGCYSSEQLLHGQKITFDNVAPVTPLLEFDIKSDSETPVPLSYLKIRTDDVPIAGDTYLTAQGMSKFLAYSHWEEEEGKSTSNEIVLHFPEGMTVMPTYSEEKYHVVLFPSYKEGVDLVWNDGRVTSWTDEYNEPLQEYGGETLYFEGYDASDKMVLTAQKTIPDAGFKSFRRYKFSLDMATTYERTDYTASSGSYVDETWN